MDHDVAAWVTEEAERGTLSARGEARSQIPTRSTADRFGVPPTPFTPPPRVDDHPGGLGTDMFLRRVRDTAARGPGASALGGGGVPGTGAKSPMPMPSAIRHPPSEPFAAERPGTPDAQESFEHDDASCARSEERTFARVVADVRAGAVAEAETPAAFESVCRVRAAELRAAAADAARASTAQGLVRADSLDAEAATWSLAWFLLGEGAEAEREGAAAETRARAIAGGSARAATRRRGSPAALRIPTRSPRPSPRACAWPRGTKRATR